MLLYASVLIETDKTGHIKSPVLDKFYLVIWRLKNVRYKEQGFGFSFYPEREDVQKIGEKPEWKLDRIWYID